ncbi:MAG: EamA family transporter [Gammaproteobacteria bacterium]|nr:EamA family transporter [Gammaproteobacteria bacterium]
MNDNKDEGLLAKRRRILGGVIALTSAVTFALNMSFASISYQHGANIHALNISRASAFLFSLLLVIAIKRPTLAMPGSARRLALIMGALLCALMYALLGAVQTIPVAIAVLIFYTYPILIAIYRWIRKEDLFSIQALLLMIIAFGGLIVVLINTPFRLEPEGTLFAVAAAVIMSLMLVVSERNLVQYNTFVVMAQSLAMVTFILLVLRLTLVEYQWPTSTTGWLAITGSTIFYVIATFTLFKAVSLIGPLRTAIIDNTAPVWAMVFGYLLLQQELTLLQLIGAATVISSVMLLQKAR